MLTISQISPFSCDSSTPKVAWETRGALAPFRPALSYSQFFTTPVKQLGLACNGLGSFIQKAAGRNPIAALGHISSLALPGLDDVSLKDTQLHSGLTAYLRGLCCSRFSQSWIAS